ncbi:hypothetical protein CEXT_737541 [Caerostris extrusa]|uniref:Uncharacterized protein n=1 Tax=Caerostris extrusa TaxID=172846 RepID=A0AAV4P662_CAEEX|nr:hypothetical protein CEXT_737541 [Caerostris extrusa]
MDTNPICLFDEGASLMIHGWKKTECSSLLVSQQLNKYKVMSSFPEHNLLSPFLPKQIPPPPPLIEWWVTLHHVWERTTPRD